MTKFLINRPKTGALAQFVMAHGAGAPMDHPFMNTIAEGLAQNGLVVSRFEFPYMAKRRATGKGGGPGSPKVLLQTWRDVINEYKGDLPLFIGGKSMGGRIASMVADEPGISGVVCLGYPFHPPGKPEKLRTEHLRTMPVPMLVIQGERDPFGNPEEVAGYDLADTVELVWVPDGDHSLKPRKKSGHTEEGNLALAITSISDFIVRLV
ncbi:MAG: alpha/beta hydrolase [Acidobacteriota bacterium]|nr:alpha/beta hydrolase [Acidobacteriota bacterium]